MSNIGRSLKGITIQLGADVTKIQTALKQVNTNIRNTQSQLKDVENTELLAQKQRLLKQAVGETKDKLDTLKKASEDAAKTKDKYDSWKAKYDPIKTKIDETTEKLKKLKEKSAEMERAGNIDTTAYQTLQREIEETSNDLKTLKQDAQKVSDEFGHPVSPEQYDALQREIIETEQDLESLQTQARNTSTSLETMAAHGEKMQQLGTNIKNVGQKMMPVTLAVTAVGTALSRQCRRWRRYPEQQVMISKLSPQRLVRWVRKRNSPLRKLLTVSSTWRWPAGLRSKCLRVWTAL